MKRLHVSFNVQDLSQSIRFYTQLFGAEPTVVREAYAKWLVEDPRMNFVIEETSEAHGFTHAGLQTESEDELQAVFERMKSAEAPYLPEGVTTCCYHKSEKSWTSDPDGVMWEAFFTHHQTEEYGKAPEIVGQ
ncbi:MAG: ArsI/CadI family heavy metal resistance metalloenzyme [Maricaulis sp.]|jgi:catechol 2,3-dioxygenase-like lactoylglutathione lyase family enzyme|uniref:ArsI/CadI family heavy metal resistance metalloenzyme n=1 Tax=Maricaulis sp. TaxID=1486257 RepID=UPI001B2CB8C3|nr:ArsI/CadI family heavy metal resistance metalloenzyme [Maricaulis sp.]MBO6730572.1 VOC family protein [Maricaulis sp.]MBO6846616.1 VOC family protein [Maricaulis sp.]MBO6877147.1 VOC family protein [Maricaulis sp.]MDM7983432.1 ArsI/CadI family heavy metal resistance metalloenzyme [Maricaulis sp.]